MDRTLGFDDKTNVYIYDDPRDDPRDRVLNGEIGRILSDHYPGWDWYVEIPPEQNMIIIRNLTCDPRGNYGYAIHKDKLNIGRLREEVCLAAGEFLERYESRRGHFGRFRPEDVDPVSALFAKPQA